MLSADKYHNILKYGPVTAVTIAIILAGITAWKYKLIPGSVSRETDAKPAVAAVTGRAGAGDWERVIKSQIAKSQPNETVEVKSTSNRFRLAGTFFALDEIGSNEVRKAILDDLSTSNQFIVIESQVVEDISITRIFKDHIKIRRGQQDDELWLTFNMQPTGPSPSISTNQPSGGIKATNAVSRFGEKMVGENRWIFDRKLLLDYYSELRDNPDRLVAIFDTLKPIYDSDSKITGYRVGIEGEAEFFKAVGFKEGDVVRSVNSLPMTNRRRAEYFIGEFVKDRANAFVIEIERDGQKDKLMYQVK